MDRLLARKLRPTVQEGADLARFLVRPHPENGRTEYSEPIAPLLRQIERSFDPPAPKELVAPLEEATRRLSIARDDYIRSQRSCRGKVQTKRFDGWTQRFNRLLGVIAG